MTATDIYAAWQQAHPLWPVVAPIDPRWGVHEELRQEWGRKDSLTWMIDHFPMDEVIRRLAYEMETPNVLDWFRWAGENGVEITIRRQCVWRVMVAVETARPWLWTRDHLWRQEVKQRIALYDTFASLGPEREDANGHLYTLVGTDGLEDEV